MDPNSSIPTALLLHDGELSDLRPLLDAIGVATIDGRSGVADADPERRWDLVIATPTKLVDLPDDLGERGRVCIAESRSRTLLKMLERANVASVIVRPVHPAALKQVLDQVLFAGHENRRNLRRAVGQSVRFRSGWRVEYAVLADLSETGCQLLAPGSIDVGRGVTVHVPRSADSSRTLSLRGEVVRTSLKDGPECERHGIHIQFGKLTNRVARSLTEIVEGLADGPAVLSRASEESRNATLDGGEPVSAGTAREPMVEPSAYVESDSDAGSDGGKELRTDPRLVYSSRIIVLGEGGARVLNAKDISSGGIRAASHPDLAVGDELQVAIPLPGEKVPLVAKARVMRNEGGLGLAFDSLPAGACERLDRALDLLPEAESRFTADADPAQIILSGIHDEDCDEEMPDQVIAGDPLEDDADADGDDDDLADVIVSKIR